MAPKKKKVVGLIKLQIQAGQANPAPPVGPALDEVLRAKPSSSKGRYLKKVTVSTTTGPGIPVDPSVTRNFTEEG